VEDEGVYVRRARRVEIDSDPCFNMNADGEIIGSCPASFEVLPRAIELIVGPEPAT
jgi:diacylglycerol kinase (ATP)